MNFEPIFFERNRVGRVYTGGKLFHGFFGDEPKDGFEPEEWIASGVHAINKVEKSPKEGVSKLLNSERYFDDLLKEYPEELLGKGNVLRILVKVLDSAIRLPAQVHPDKEFSRSHFASEYGKTESWLILDTREDAKIFFGFRDGVSKEAFSDAIEKSETDRNVMEELLLGITPRVGDVYLVPAKTPHAIGKGCLILEIQEPTDFTIQPERYCGDYRLSDKEMYLTLTKEEALDCFTFGKPPRAKVDPTVYEQGNGVTKERLIGEENTDCFVINRVTLQNGEAALNVAGGYAIYIVTEGEGVLTGEGYEKRVRKGDYFFMPACLMGRYAISGQLQVVECY